MSPKIDWPSVFIEGSYKFSQRGEAIGVAYCGWANCYIGGPIPKNFGKGMECIKEYLGIENVDPDSLEKL